MADFDWTLVRSFLAVLDAGSLVGAARQMQGAVARARGRAGHPGRAGGVQRHQQPAAPRSDIAVRMLRPAQAGLVAKKLGDIAIVAAAHDQYLQRHGTPRQAADLLQHRLLGYDRDDTLRRGFAAMGLPVARAAFALRSADQVACVQLVAAGAGIGFVTAYVRAQLPGVRPLLPMLQVPPLPCWLAVHREIRGSKVVRRVFDFLAQAVPAQIAQAGSR